MKSFVPSPPISSIKIIAGIPEFKELSEAWRVNGKLDIEDVRDMMRYAQDLVRKNRTAKLSKIRDTLESIVSQYENSR